MTTTERYNQLKKSWPGAIVLMRCGDFYETYDEDARKCNELCGLTLTQRNGKAQALTGFPYHALEGYVKKLHDAGRATVVCNDDFSNSTTINNNQNSTTTMEAKKFRIINIFKCFIFDAEAQALTEAKLVRNTYYLQSGKSEQEWLMANTGKVVKTTYTPATETEPAQFDGVLYETQEAFENARPMTLTGVPGSECNEQRVCNYLSDSVCQDDDDTKGAYIWAFINGEAKKWYFNQHMDTVTVEYDGACRVGVKSDCECGIPEAYCSCEEVYKYNDYRTIDKDGKEIVHEGVYQRLKLEPDQEKILDKLQAVIDECKEAGIEVYWSVYNYELCAVNRRRIERIEYDPCVDEETEAAFRFEERPARRFKNVVNHDRCDDMFVIKK